MRRWRARVPLRVLCAAGMYPAMGQPPSAVFGVGGRKDHRTAAGRASLRRHHESALCLSDADLTPGTLDLRFTGLILKRRHARGVPWRDGSHQPAAERTGATEWQPSVHPPTPFPNLLLGEPASERH